ncbi:hypothetical protein HPB52_001311 [Rhipicephalus sanguineus]|uniref:Uncharacterized protein n=1 Tax=Rhipicephalus sanguineus TaxID=34632 RepID=A0A9D4PY88_RHISA|nr:hypothetical protein HPB52_001311 [Rhipicephalus sanguineus]
MVDYSQRTSGAIPLHGVLGHRSTTFPRLSSITTRVKDMELPPADWLLTSPWLPYVMFWLVARHRRLVPPTPDIGNMRAITSRATTSSLTFYRGLWTREVFVRS